jgi:hypothetical protein
MPYVPKNKREKLNPYIHLLFGHINTKGDINYIITSLAHLWALWQADSTFDGKRNYEARSTGYDVLSEAAMEYYASVMLPYEQKKKIENGPISELDDEKSA